ncbi:hypothetical protein V496_04024 [Pseudogymnoascus sp. VKM F-4515 (FW-2607)]|nr:hypothetical protein V496_04024 [Pseudogymnoascus sp. VKM F-4515 (FW-2607)]
MTSSILLQGGTVLYHGDDDYVTALKDTDILVTGNLVSKIGKDIEAPEGATVIDCKGKIVSPGFIDTHHHLWQTQLKGRHMDETLLGYMLKSNMHSYSFTPEDMFWGQLAGCLEAIDAGTTYVLDHSHGNYTPEHATQCLSATTTSGLRSTYAYSHPPASFSSWTSSAIVPSSSILPPQTLDHLESLALAQPHANGRVTIGLGFDFYFLPRETVIGIFERFRKAGVKVITSHVTKNAIFGEGSTVELLDSYGLLGPDLVLSHATNLTPKEHAILYAAKVYVSSTPSSESQTALGWPVALRSGVHGSLGVDSQTFCGSSILSEARAALLLARQETNSTLLAKGEYPQNLAGGAREAFNLATVGGARAVGMGDKIGRVREGYLADLVVVDAQSPGMVGASGWDPVVAVVGHSGIRDAETVIVDGVVRKRGGRLVGVELHGGERLEWEGVAERVERSRREVQKRIEGLDLGVARELVVGMWHIDESKLKDVEY